MDPEDKHGQPLTVGDTVEVPYGGDLHVGVIKHLAEEAGVLVAHVETVAVVPVSLARKVAKEKGAAVSTRRRSAH